MSLFQPNLIVPDFEIQAINFLRNIYYLPYSKGLFIFYSVFIDAFRIMILILDMT